MRSFGRTNNKTFKVTNISDRALHKLQAHGAITTKRSECSRTGYNNTKMPATHLSQALEQVWKSERQLGEAFLMIADRTDNYYEFQRKCTLFGHWSFGHSINLDEFLLKYSSIPRSRATTAHTAPFTCRAAGEDLYHHLQELVLLAQQTRSVWTTLAEAAREAGDDELIAVTTRCAAENDRQIIWLNDEFTSFSLLLCNGNRVPKMRPNQAKDPL